MKYDYHPHLNPWNLKFSGDQAELEPAYKRQNFADNLQQQRVVIWISIFVYAVFMFVDATEMPEYQYTFWAIRLIGYTPIAIFTLFLMRSPVFERIGEWVISVASLVGALGLLAIHFMGGSSGFYSYRYAIVFMLFFLFTLIKLPFVKANAIGLMVIVIYLFLQIATGVFPSDVHFDTLIFWSVVYAFGAVGLYYNERNERKQFFLQYLIEQEKDKVLNANIWLESKVKERTQKLNAVNSILSRANENLISSEFTFRRLFEDTTDAIMIIENAQIVDCNKALLELFQYDNKSQIVGQLPWQFSPYEQVDGRPSEDLYQEYLERVQSQDGERGLKFQWHHQKQSGNIFPVEIVLTHILLKGKRVVHAMIRDISERYALQKQLEFLSFHDQLTGIYNRRFFETELSRLDVPRNLPMSVIMADVNGLKLINDSFGHESGDDLLKSVAHIMTNGCRSDEIVARLGGDEFVILLPKTDEEVAQQMVKRILALSEKENVNGIDLSVSFGFATKYDAADSMEDILKAAEDRMYRNKLFEGPSMRSKAIKVIVKTLNEKNLREEEHSKRVAELAKQLGVAIGLESEQLHALETVGMLHDIGKIAIDENILNKPGTLTDVEMEQMRRHPEIGYRILSAAGEMVELSEYILYHHEHWDGNGYPKGISGERIPKIARIIAIVDAFDAMTSDRTYRKAHDVDYARRELIKFSGTQFDPELVDVFINSVINKTPL